MAMGGVPDGIVETALQLESFFSLKRDGNFVNYNRIIAETQISFSKKEISQNTTTPLLLNIFLIKKAWTFMTKVLTF